MNRRFQKRFRCGHTAILLIVVFLIFMCLINIDFGTTKTSSNFSSSIEYKALSSAAIESKRWKSHSSEHKTTLLTRRTCEHYYYLLILVSSAPANLDRRNNIRKTWASDKELKWPRWKTLFLLGQTSMQNVSESLLKEDEEFGDLVQANYIENYYNQTYKIQMGFEWAIRYCEFSFLLKVDDDVFVDGIAVISYLSEPSTPKKELYAGNLVKWAKPVRKEDAKWSTSYDEYGVACVASVSVLFPSKDRAKNGASKGGGCGEERKETLADKPRDFENRLHRLSCLSARTDI